MRVRTLLRCVFAVVVAASVLTGPVATGYAVVPTPAVSMVLPTAGSIVGGTRVELTGTSFAGASKVLFGGVPGTDIAVSSDSALSVTTPAHVAGLVDVKVVTAGGTSWGRASDRFTYSTLRPTLAPTPADSVDVGDLNGVTCPVLGWCLVLGEYTDPAQRAPGLLDTVSGGQWTATRAPLPPGTDPILSEYVSFEGASCAAAGTCVAVGAYVGNDPPEVQLIETLSDGAWTPTVPPLPADAATSDNSIDNLSGVSCPTRTWCVAVGSYTGTDGASHAVVETLAGGVWTAVESAPPTGGRGVTGLTAVTCTAVRACVAVGGYLDSAGSGRGLIETLAGGTWTPTAAPSSGTGPIGYVTCPAPDWCAAIGYPYAYTYSHGAWSRSTLPQPSDASSARYGDRGIWSLDCPVPRWCVAVGQYMSKYVSPSLGRSRALVETLANGAWSTSGAAVPYGSYLWSVSCRGRGECVTVGSQEYAGPPETRPTVGLVETDHDGVWTYGSMPGTASLGQLPWAAPRAVSCTGGSCIAVGTYGGVERWKP